MVVTMLLRYKCIDENYVEQLLAWEDKPNCLNCFSTSNCKRGLSILLVLLRDWRLKSRYLLKTLSAL